MKQYPVPQFIERDAKLTFFLSFKQTLYLIAGGATCFVVYFMVPPATFLVVAVLIMIISVALAFLKIDDKPILSYLLGSAGFAFGTKKYIWKKKETFSPIRKGTAQKQEGGEGEGLKMGRGSQLKNKKTNIEFN